MATASGCWGKPRVRVVTDKIEKPDADDRVYRIIRLANELEVVLVQDAKADKASAALSVGVGSYTDDKDMPGLAHAVEHMLFMGTEKYPVENEYSNYLSAHNGYSNAYTRGTSTVYFFAMAATSEVQSNEAQSFAAAEKDTINHSFTNGVKNTNADTQSSEEAIFYGALDRFAQFFVKPLFLESSLEREMQSVNSENNGNLQSDRWRLSKLTGSLCNPEHPLNRFTTGNIQTLYDEPLAKGIDVRKRFIDFYEQNYSANRMKLVVLGRETLDELETWVVELFSGIENKNLVENRWDGIPLMGEDGAHLTVYAKPIKDARKLTIMFPYPDEDEMYESDPQHYISHLIGHEGEGSLLSYLKKKDLADDLSCGGYTTCPGSGSFTISVALTEQGLKNFEEVVTATFQYIGMLNETEPKEDIFRELQSIGELTFRFKQKEEPYEFTRDLADGMQLRFPRERILSTDLIQREFDPAAIKEGLAALSPDNARITITSQHAGKTWTHKEKWYGTEYTTEKWSPEFLGALETAVSSTAATRPKDLHLHRPNEFIPTRLDVHRKEVLVPAKNPKILRNDERVRLWHKKDDQFWVPKAQLQVILYSRFASSTAEDVAVASMFTALVSDALVEYSYEASLASLQYRFGNGLDHLSIDLAGFNDKMPVLLKKVLDTIKNGEFSQERFVSIQEAKVRAEKNTRYGDLHMQPREFRTYMSTSGTYLSEQRAKALENVTMDDVKKFLPRFLREVRMEILAVGNLTKDDALEAAAMCESILKPTGVPQTRLPCTQAVILPPGSNYVYQRQVQDPENINNCLEQCIWTGSTQYLAAAAVAQLTSAILKEPFYDQLRTTEQLGYVVQSGYGTPWPHAHHFILLRVQSVRPVDYLEGRIEVFLTRLEKLIRDMDASKFEKHKAGLCNSILEKDKTIYDEASNFLGQIFAGSYYFDEEDDLAAAVRKLAKEDVLDFYNTHLAPTSATRAKLSVHLISQKKPTEAAKLTDEERLESLTSTLAKHLTGTGIPANQEQLKARFSGVELSGDNEDTMVSSLTDYLTDDAKLSSEVVEKILVEGKAQLIPLLASVGLAPATSSKDDSGNDIVLQDRTYVTDLDELKRSLPKYPMLKPVKDLSEFTDSELKL